MVAVAVAESWAAVQNGNNSAELSGKRPSFSKHRTSAQNHVMHKCDVLLEHTLDAKREC